MENWDGVLGMEHGECRVGIENWKRSAGNGVLGMEYREWRIEEWKWNEVMGDG